MGSTSRGPTKADGALVGIDLFPVLHMQHPESDTSDIMFQIWSQRPSPAYSTNSTPKYYVTCLPRKNFPLSTREIEKKK
jgi:hypothetical protein